MKLKMAENSLFAILLRSPWWISLALAVGLAVLAQLALPEKYAGAGMLGGLPFVVIAAMAAQRQWRAPSAAQAERTLQQLQALGAAELATVLEAAFAKPGHAVRRLNGGGADFEVVHGARRTLVSHRRWKAARTGVQPLRELHAAQQRLQADDGIYIGGGELGDKARAFAKASNIRLLNGDELVRLMRDSGALPARSA